MSSKPNIAFFGLGTMGAGMSRRLVGAGYNVTAWNRSPEKAATLAAENPAARAAKTPREAAEGAQVLISIVADDISSKAVWTGETGALAAAAPGTVVIECSTITVPWARELNALCEAKGVGFLDAPVTGTKPHAANGELIFIVGGKPETLEKVRPVLAVMSKEILPIGPAGAGATLKLINNFVCGVQAAALGEATALMKRAGLDTEKALPLLLNGAPGSPLFKGFAGRVNTNDPTIYFQLQHMAKDIRYALGEAKSHNLDMHTATAALETFTRATQAGYGTQDVSRIITYMIEKGGK